MMKLFRNILTCILLVVGTLTMHAQAPAGNVQMADGFYAEGKIYVVIGVVAIVFIGLAVYLFMIERKVKKLEEALKEKK
ncbi:MAG TPA: CcmD family protein [Bacteroidia bacterium]